MNNSSAQFTTLANGTLDPDSRVNYEYGLVLGVNEFRQEQQYFLGKDQLHNSELHGYGTISGLSVGTAPYPSADSPNDVQVTIKPGMAIDQQGKTLIVRADQCARLGAWLALQIKNDPDTLKKHPPDENGFISVYIVASYAEEQEQPVPVTGSLTNNGDTTYARIRDAFDIEFSWHPPHMPAWDAVREFAVLLSRIHIVPGIPGDSDDDDNERSEAVIKAICHHVRRIGRHHTDHHEEHAANEEAQERERAEGEKEKVWYLPEYLVQDALDRIFTIWTTEVHPHLSPNLIDGQSAITDQQAGVLLGRIDFVPDDPFLVNKPRILKFAAPDTSRCPFLLSTQLLQELIAVGGRDVPPPREFATLQTLDNRTLQVWLHHPASIVWPPDVDDWSEILRIKSDGQSLTIAEVVPGNQGNVFEIHIDADDDDAMLLPGARVELTFKVEQFPLREDDDGDDRPRDEDSGLVAGVENIGGGAEQGAKDILKGHFVQGTERAVEGILQGAEDVVEGAFKGVEDVVKDTAKGVEDVVGGIEKGAKDAVHGKLARGAEDVVQGAAHGVEDVVQGAVTGVEDVLGTPEGDEHEQREGKHKHRRCLGDSINDFGIDYVGYDRVSGTITIYTIAAHWPTRELVTLYVFNPQVTSVRPEHPASALSTAAGAEATLHLWFHTEKPVKLPESCQVLVPRGFTGPPQAMTFTVVPPPDTTYSYFWALIPPAEFPLLPGELLTVTLDTDQILVQSTDDKGGNDNSGSDITNTGAPGESSDVTNTGAKGEEADTTNTGAKGEEADATNTGAADDDDDITLTDNKGEGKADNGHDAHDNSNDDDGDDDAKLTLTDILKYLPYRFAGYDGDHSIVAHHQVPTATPTVVEAGKRRERQEEQNERERRERRELQQPTMLFVTITHLAEREEVREATIVERFELWFHLVSDPTDEIASFNESMSCELFAELSDLRRSSRVEVTDISALQLNVFVLSATLPQPTENQQAYYLRFKFPLNANPVSIRRGPFFHTLGEYIESRGSSFEGFNGRDAIVAYVRIPVRRRR